MLPAMELERLLHSQGFGSRKACRALIEAGRVALAAGPCLNPKTPVSADLAFWVDEQPWQAASKVYLLLNKPTGYECSRAPQHHLPVLRLLPAPYVERGVQPVGRLDADTTGLLLLSDDGQFIHHFTSFFFTTLNKLCIINIVAPMQIKLSATLKAGQWLSPM